MRGELLRTFPLDDSAAKEDLPNNNVTSAPVAEALDIFAMSPIRAIFAYVTIIALFSSARVILWDIVQLQTARNEGHYALPADASWASLGAQLTNPREKDVVVRGCCNIDLSVTIKRGSHLRICATVLAALALPANLIRPSHHADYARLAGLRGLIFACSDATARQGSVSPDLPVECSSAVDAGRAYARSAAAPENDVVLTRLLLGPSACVDSTRASQVLMLEMPRHVYSSGIITVHVSASGLGKGNSETLYLRRTFFLVVPPPPRQWAELLPHLIESADPLLRMRDQAEQADAALLDAAAAAAAAGDIAESAYTFASALYGGGTLGGEVQVQELLAASQLHTRARTLLQKSESLRSVDVSPAGSIVGVHARGGPGPAVSASVPSHSTSSSSTSSSASPAAAYVTLLYSDAYAPGVAALATSLAAASAAAAIAAESSADGSSAGSAGSAEPEQTLLVMVGCRRTGAGAGEQSKERERGMERGRGRGVRLRRQRTRSTRSRPRSGLVGQGSQASGDSDAPAARLGMEDAQAADAKQVLRLISYDAPPFGWQPMVSAAWLDTLLALGRVLACDGNGDGDGNARNVNGSSTWPTQDPSDATRGVLLSRARAHLQSALGASQPAATGETPASASKPNVARGLRLRIRLVFVPWLEGLAPGVSVIGLDAGVWMKLHAWALAPHTPSHHDDPHSQTRPPPQAGGQHSPEPTFSSFKFGPGSASATASTSIADGYGCLIFLDADILVHQPLDHLFRLPVCDSDAISSRFVQQQQRLPSSRAGAPAIAGVAGVSVETADLETGIFNVGLLVLRPSLTVWQQMLFQHVAAHSTYQVIETSFINAFFIPEHPPASAAAHWQTQHMPEPEHPDSRAAPKQQPGSEVHGAHDERQSHLDVAFDAGIAADSQGAPRLTGSVSTYSWVLPLNYWCLAEVAARYDDPSLCITFDFSSCGVARWKPWLPGDPPTDEAGLLCRGKPPSQQYKSLIAAWRGVFAATTEALISVGHAPPVVTVGG